MPIPSSINDLSTTAASNSPSGSEDLGTADDYLRVYASYIAALRDVVLSGTANLSTANLTYTGTLTGSTGVLNIGSGQIYKDASGNVGIGLTPLSQYRLDLGDAGKNVRLRVGGAIAGNSGNGYPSVGYNALPSGASSWNRDISDVASWIHFSAGDHVFYTGATGAAGTAITPTVIARFNSSGNFGIGGSPTYALDLRTPSARLLVKPSTATNSALAMYSNTAGDAYTGLDDSVGTISGAPYALAFWHAGAYPAVFGTNNAERMRIDSSGNQINTPSNTPPTLTVNGQMNITPTSNTNVRISYRGSDGTTRTANITLA